MKLITKFIPIGLFLQKADFEAFAGNLNLEDSTCLRCLDKQIAGSVIYVALGSRIVLSAEQLNKKMN